MKEQYRIKRLSVFELVEKLHEVNRMFVSSEIEKGDGMFCWLDFSFV
jgi:hypothetical protein